MNERNKKSPVWKYFTCLKEDLTKAECSLCKTLVSRGGIGKKATTTALNNHLKKKHPQLKLVSTGTDIDENTDEPPKNKEKNLQQQTLETCVNKRKLWDITSDKSIEIHYAIGEMMALDNRPFSVVSDVGFKRLINLLQPQYQLPSRKYFSDVVVPDIYEKCKKKIALQMNEAKHVSITSDIWTDTTNNCSFFSFTGHWINNEFELNNAALNIKHFPGNHTGENIGDLLLNLCNTWNLKEKIHLVVRDNGANIVKGIEDAGFSSAPCFIHTLQLVVKDSLKCQRMVTDVIAISKNIVTHFHHSSAACSKLKYIQTNTLNETSKKLIQDVSTRWNSIFYMLERLLEQKKAITLYATEHGGIQNLSSSQWSTLENIINLLKPFEEVTKNISSSKSIISEVVPTVAILQRYLSKTGKQFFGVGTMKAALEDSLASRFSEICKNDNFVLATLLDPRFKAAFFVENVTTNAKRLILEEMRPKDQLNNVELEVEDDKIEIDDSNPSRKRKLSNEEEQFSLWDCFDELTNTNRKPKVSISSEKKSSASASTSQEDSEEELNLYLSTPLIDRTTDPLKWWQLNKTSYSTLAQLAQKYLSAPASSVYSERLFSEAGNVYDKKRNRLLPDNVEDLLFIHHNLPLLNYNYK